MFRLLLSWMPSLLRLSGIFVVTISPCILGLVLPDVPTALRIGLAGVILGMLLFFYYRFGFYLARFGKATWRFRTVAADSIILRYAPELQGRIDVEDCLKHARQTYADFAQKFGLTLRRRLVIFLFPTATSISRIFRSPYGGFALVGGDAIGVSADRPPGGTIAEVVTHELAHLFSARLGKLDPAFKSEGLATWLMTSIDGKPIDFYTLATLLADRCVFLTWLVPSVNFYQIERSYSYNFAGSFTGYLLERFGWERYRDFFRRANGKNFEACFAQVFGQSLLKTEQQWRDDLLNRRPTFEPELTRYMAERSIEAAYQAGHVYRCLEEIDALARLGPVSGNIRSYAAWTHFYLGHYREAADAIEQALQSDDPWIRSQRGSCLLLLGYVHDLLGERHQAEQAYQAVLAEPEYWSGSGPSVQALARRYQQRAFTESDLRAMLQPPGKESRRQRRSRR